MTPGFYLSAPAILGALVLDLLAGDPTGMPHPVRLIGRLITAGEQRSRTGRAAADLRNGTWLVVIVIAATALTAWTMIAGASALSGAAGLIVALVLAWTTLALRGLGDAARAVAQALARGDDEAARRLLPALVGRDPEVLDRTGIVRAVVESVAENASDGVIAPLFFLFLGGPIVALAYKAINTLDSMIGYRDERYLYFGRAAARLDDVVNYLPARLTAVGLIAAAQLTRGRGAEAWAACRADASRHASPNAGYPEAAMAGALGLQLGGEAIYGGVIEPRATLGRAENPPRVTHINDARRLLYLSTAIAFSAFAATRWLIEAALR